MCLAIPARVAAIDGVMATVEVGEVRREVSLLLLDGVRVGDYVTVQTGYAVARLDAEDALRTLALFAEVAAQAGVPWPGGHGG